MGKVIEYRGNELANAYQDAPEHEKDKVFSELVTEYRRIIDYHSYLKTKYDRRLIKEDVEQEMKILLLRCLRLWDRDNGAHFAGFYTAALRFNRYKGSRRITDCVSEHLCRTKYDTEMELDMEDEIDYQHRYQTNHDGRKVFKLMRAVVGERDRKILFQLWGLELLSTTIGKKHKMSSARVCQIRDSGLRKLRAHSTIGKMMHEYSS